MTTSVLWNSHASVLIRSGDDLFLTDPWYGIAFSSWSPHPVPAINPDMLIGLAKSGRLKVIVSHAHDDHLDRTLLAKLEGATIYVPHTPDHHLTRLIPNSIEITGPAQAGACTLNSWEATHSAVISIETPDCTILHGNDVYALAARTVTEINQFINRAGQGLPRLYMGQGGSASGWPLRYRYDAPGRARRANTKQAAIMYSLYDLALQLGSHRILAYACYARAEVDGTEYLPMDSSGRRANELNGTDLFLDMEPGDIFIPSDDNIVKLLPSLNAHAYPRPKMPTFPDLWDLAANRMKDFMAGIKPIAEKHNLSFTIDVAGGGQYAEGPDNPQRYKTCYVSRAIMSNVLAGRIPLTDLSTGYLAEWDRSPDEPNIEFLTELEDYGYKWAEAQSETHLHVKHS